MKFYYTFFTFVFCFSFCYGQIGVGTNTPGGILDIESSTMGVVYPKVALVDTDTETVVNPAPMATGILAGTTVYNTVNNGSGVNAVVPGIYTWNGSEWSPQFHKRDYEIYSQNTNLRTRSNAGIQSISFNASSFTPYFDGEYLIIITAHFGGGELDNPNTGNDQHVNFASQEGIYEFTFNGTTQSFSLSSFSGKNHDNLFDGGTNKNYVNSFNQATVTKTEVLTRGTNYNFNLTFNQTPSNGFVNNGNSSNGRGFIIVNDNLHCTIEFKYIGN